MFVSKNQKLSVKAQKCLVSFESYWNKYIGLLLFPQGSPMNVREKKKEKKKKINAKPKSFCLA